MSLYTLPSPAGYRALPSGLLTLDSRSPNVLATPQPFPNTAADLIAALGATGVILPANVLAIYNLTTASPLQDYLGLGPNLSTFGAALASRECIGLPGTNFVNTVGVELAAAGDGFRAPNGTFCAVPVGGIISALVVWRAGLDAAGAKFIITKVKNADVGWGIYLTSGLVAAIAYGAGFAGTANIPTAFNYDAAWHCIAAVVNDVTKRVYAYSDLGDAPSSNYGGNIYSTNGRFAIGTNGEFVFSNSVKSQIAYLACFDVALTSAQRATFWRSILANSDLLGTDNTYARTGPLVTPITASRVACYGAGQPAIGYAANASAGDNPLKLGVVCEDGVSFLGLGTDNMPAFVGTNATVTAADGPSGMRDAARVADTDGVNAGYATSGAATLAGATNVSFRFGMMCQQVTAGGTNALLQAYFTGDGGGPELFTVATLAGTVPAAWGRFGGAVTPTGAAHTAVVTRSLPTDGVGASQGTVDFAEEWGVQNSAVDRLAWRRAAAGAASATGAQTLSYANPANAVYRPAQGRLRLRVTDFAGTNGATFLGFGAAAAAGALVLDYNAGALRLRVWNNAGALVGTATGGVLAAATEYTLTVIWDATVGKFAVLNGATVLCSFGGTWTPAAAGPNPIYVGSDAAGANAARCYCVLLNGYDY